MRERLTSSSRWVPHARHLHAWTLLLVLVAGFGLRVWNVNWDQDQHLHPDERYWTFVTDDVEIPNGIGEYFDSATSPLNPYQYQSTFVYGTAPMLLTKVSAEWLSTGIRDQSFPAGPLASVLDGTVVDLKEGGEPLFDDDYNSHVVGRLWSAIFGTLTILLTYHIARRLHGPAVGLIAAGFIAANALHIQYSHFYGSEAIATFFVTATVLGAVHMARAPARWLPLLGAGVVSGLAIATKLNSVVAVFAILAAVIVGQRDDWPSWLRARPSGYWPRLDRLVIGALVVIVTFRITQPYAFAGGWSLQLDARWIDDLRQLSELQAGSDFPPNVQWVDRTPLLFPLGQLVRWGYGPAAAFAALLGVGLTCRRILRRGERQTIILLAPIAAMLVLIAQQRNPTLRYMLPIYPLLAVFSARGVAALWYGATTRSAAFKRLRRVIPAALVLLAGLWGVAFTAGVYGATHSRIAASEWIVDNVPDGSVLSAQAWDDALPLNLPGVADLGYEHVTLDPFATDSPATTQALIDGLEQIDYIVESSNRVYGAVGQIPARYPATITYYQMLFEERLGFELVAEFSNPPQLLGLVINDGAAEEAFTVYDHPTVTIWHKTAAFDPDAARALLGIDRSRTAIGALPGDSDANALQLRPQAYAEQQAGGTFADVFSGGPPGPQWLWWFVFLQITAFAAVPWTTALFSKVPGRGYGLSKVFGPLSVALPVWLLVSWEVVSFGRPVIWLVWLTVVGSGAGVGWQRRSALVDAWRTNRFSWATAEIAFMLVFFAILAVRAANPDLWHPFRGGEKPFELAQLTAVAKSSVLPPFDPWFAGGSLNYFYFGYFIAAIPTRALGIAPEIGFNLAVATFAAMSAGSAHATAASLFPAASTHRRKASEPTRTEDRGGALVGSLGVACLLVAGNLAVPLQFIGRLRDVVAGTPRAEAPAIDWWAASRVNEGLLDITEFPAWSFLFGDLHPHVMGICMLLAVAAFVRLHIEACQTNDTRRRVVSIIALGLIAAVVRMTNTWDTVTVFLLAALAIGVGATQLRGTVRARLRAGSVGLLGFGIVHLAIVYPYLESSQVFNAGIVGAEHTTPLKGWVIQFWLFIGIAVGHLSQQVLRLLRNPYNRPRSAELAMVAGSILMLAVAVSATISLVAGLSAGLVALFLIQLALDIQRRAVRDVTVAMLFLVGFGITAGVDIVTIQDDIGRMNTVFKFWYQAWTLLAIASAAATWGLVSSARSWMRSRQRSGSSLHRLIGGTALRALGTATLLCALGFWLLALSPRVNDRFSSLPDQLDGLAYLRNGATIDTPDGPVMLGDDVVLIDWLRANVTGSPTIVEAVGDPYQWPARMSAMTGLPTVVGWDNHQRQQRGVFAAEVQKRRIETEAFWTTPDPTHAAGFLRAYDVSYVIVGVEELRRADAGLLALLEDLPGVESVFTSGPHQILAVDKRAIRGLEPGDWLPPFVADVPSSGS